MVRSIKVGVEMWVVGTLRDGEFIVLPESAKFAAPLDAKAWARDYLAKYPDLLQRGRDLLTWRLETDPRGPQE
jgi:hypothetical protein